MTIPIERSYAIQNVREFLYSLLDPQMTPRVPKAIRQEARWHLKHFPSEVDMEATRKKCPEIFGKPREKNT
jgi:hypothetical protein